VSAAEAPVLAQRRSGWSSARRSRLSASRPWPSTQPHSAQPQASSRKSLSPTCRARAA